MKPRTAQRSSKPDPRRRHRPACSMAPGASEDTLPNRPADAPSSLFTAAIIPSGGERTASFHGGNCTNSTGMNLTEPTATDLPKGPVRRSSGRLTRQPGDRPRKLLQPGWSRSANTQNCGGIRPIRSARHRSRKRRLCGRTSRHNDRRIGCGAAPEAADPPGGHVLRQSSWCLFNWQRSCRRKGPIRRRHSSPGTAVPNDPDAVSPRLPHGP